jgi:hypothetical protein
MFKKKNIINFESAIDIYPDNLVPAKKLIPKWYKDIPKWQDGILVSPPNPKLRKTLKNCIPFLDALISGYIVTLAHDVVITKDSLGNPFLTANHYGDPAILNRDIEMSYVQKPNGFYKNEFAWNFPLAIEIPKGYSVLVTHPFNRFDLPFITLTGIIDSGWIIPAGGQAPFILQNNFDGILTKGTPIMQIIPFKNENWILEKKNNLVESAQVYLKKSNSVISGWYKNNIWNKKSYD